jgi:hypothetical protein
MTHLLSAVGGAYAGMHVFVKGSQVNTCSASFTAPAVSTEVAVGDSFTITVSGVDSSDCVNAPTRAEVNPASPGSVFVGLSLTGPGEFILPNLPAKLPNARDDTVNLNVSGGSGSVQVRATGPGSIVVTITSVDGDNTFSSSRDTVTVTVRNVVVNVVAKLLLTPHKARRHVHEHIAVTAVALDANNTAVAGALVAFSAFGDCQPLVHPSAAVTNDKGWATVHLTSHEPGAVAVVAAAAGANSIAVISPPSHIIWVDEEHHADEREGYYGR